jgi:hypothetical protein
MAQMAFSAFGPSASLEKKNWFGIPKNWKAISFGHETLFNYTILLIEKPFG